ncbi:MAG: cyclomaltodextrinase N-terminal domain-containing protein, partial [Prevotella sp.]|nr:cyclomaltodextrinase N-terminal domain-containing protein [Prevotella sp.]
MKKNVLILFFILFSYSIFAIEVKNVEPAFWWAGMKNTELQVLLYGDNIALCDVNITAKTVVRLKETVKLENPNYLLLYIDLEGAEPEKFDIRLQRGKEKKNVSYELKERENGSADRKGFDAGDILYLIMPDRFANGDPSNDEIFGYPINRNNPSSRHGGDFKGIENNLDYLEQLGITTVWLNPVLENNMNEYEYPAYH